MNYYTVMISRHPGKGSKTKMPNVKAPNVKAPKIKAPKATKRRKIKASNDKAPKDKKYRSTKSIEGQSTELPKLSKDKVPNLSWVRLS